MTILVSPPLIIQSNSINSKEDSDELLEAAFNLRASGVGLFEQDDKIALLNGNVDKGTFLEFVRYCDEGISKLITGQVLAGNSVTNGTQALGKVHEGIKREILGFDAFLLSSFISGFLKEILRVNFANAKSIEFVFDTNTEAEESTQADVYLKLTQMGYTIPKEHIERVFKIEGLSANKYEQNATQSSAVEKNRGKADCEGLNKQAPFKNTKNAIKGKFLDSLDKEFTNLEPISKFELDSLLESCSTYEEALNKINQSLVGQELLNAEEDLLKYIANAEILGLKSFEDELK